MICLPAGVDFDDGICNDLGAVLFNGALCVCKVVTVVSVGVATDVKGLDQVVVMVDGSVGCCSGVHGVKADFFAQAPAEL